MHKLLISSSLTISLIIPTTAQAASINTSVQYAKEATKSVTITKTTRVYEYRRLCHQKQ